MGSLEATLKHFFGYSTFWEGQRQVIEQVLTGRDVFVLMPTGGGKSLIYQLPALIQPGLTIVVSPLIALMQDQVERLQANGIAATFINSSLSPNEREMREWAALHGELKLLYVAPERLMTESFLRLMEKIDQQVGLALLAIDEAHCVSEWGHDFRPEYRSLGRLRQLILLCPCWPSLPQRPSEYERTLWSNCDCSNLICMWPALIDLISTMRFARRINTYMASWWSSCASIQASQRSSTARPAVR